MALEKQTIKEAEENLKRLPIINALRSNKNTIYLKHEYSVIKVKQQSTRMGYQNEKKKSPKITSVDGLENKPQTNKQKSP